LLTARKQATESVYVTHKEVYKNLTLAYKKWNNYSRDHPSAIKKAEIFSIEQGTAMLELPTENKRTILDKVVLVLSWYGGERILDIYKHLSKNISIIDHYFVLKHCRK
jgi:hypothetical protein